jgi:hypothetical protein
MKSLSFPPTPGMWGATPLAHDGLEVEGRMRAKTQTAARSASENSKLAAGSRELLYERLHLSRPPLCRASCRFAPPLTADLLLPVGGAHRSSI